MGNPKAASERQPGERTGARESRQYRGTVAPSMFEAPPSRELELRRLAVARWRGLDAVSCEGQRERKVG